MKTKVLYRQPLGNPHRAYRQDRFIISACRAWGAGELAEAVDVRGCIKLCKEIGCNLTEYIWADPQLTRQCIAACEEFEIDGLFQNWDAFGGFQTTKGSGKLNMGELREFISLGERYRHFAGYTVWDEPVSDADIAAAAEQLRVLEKLDPARLPYTVAIPSYNTVHTWQNGTYEEYLTHYAETIDPAVMAMDYYPFSATRPDPYDQLDNSLLFLDMALLRKLSVSQRTPMWFCIQALDCPFGERYYRFTPEKIAMQAYNAMLHGCKGIQLYNTVEGVMYNDGRKGPLYFPIKALNRRLYQWGKTLMALESRHVFHSPELLASCRFFERYREPVAKSRILADNALPPRCSVGELEDREGNLYLLILNRDYEQARSFRLQLKAPFRVYGVRDEDGKQYLQKRVASILTLQLSPGDAVLLRLQDAQEEPFLIDYVLDKQDSIRRT